MKAVGILLLLAGVVGIASATPIPEIDPGSAGNALALFAGVLLIARGRKK